jgi:hypothetical protein
MPLDEEADVGRDLVLDPLDVGARELEDRVAGVADEVVVVLPLVLPLEAGLALQLQLLGEAGGMQELEGPVDRGAPDVGAALLASRSRSSTRGDAPSGKVSR